MSNPPRATAAAGQAATQGASHPAQPSPGAAAGGSGRSRTMQRAVGPPGSERGMNLQPQRPRSAQTGGATEPLKRDQRPATEGEVHGMRSAARLERVARGPGDHPLGVAVERVGRAVSGLGRALERDRRTPLRPSRRSARPPRRAAARRGASGPAATSNAVGVSGRKTLRPSSPSGRASAASEACVGLAPMSSGRWGQSSTGAPT